MGLISEEVTVSWQRGTCTRYKNSGYIFTKIGNRFNVKVEHLTDKSMAKVDVQCDNCTTIKNITWCDYKKYVKEDGKYYCNKCAMKLYGGENKRLSQLKNGKSFEQWCIENNRQDILDRWDYELNKYKPNGISHNSHINIWLKCSNGIHNSELKNINKLVNNRMSINCKMCNSFAQWGINNLGNDFLEKYWDYELNTVNPWNINKNTHQKVWIKCQEKNYHESYHAQCKAFINGVRCPYCSGNRGRVHILDSLEHLYPQVSKIWSNKNNKSANQYTPFSQQSVWWKCQQIKHKDYQRTVAASNIYSFRCPECIKEQEESIIQEKVRLYLNERGFTILHERNCTIMAQNPRYKGSQGQMPYDNEIVELKLIIEVHGEQHYKITNFHNMHAKRNNKTPEYELHMQQVRDRYKRMYAKYKGYYYLEIPYWTDDKNETWKQMIDDKIKEIKNKL